MGGITGNEVRRKSRNVLQQKAPPHNSALTSKTAMRGLPTIVFEYENSKTSTYVQG